MSHEIEQMFSVRETPWHGLGVIVQDAPNAKEAIRLAGLDWNVKHEKLVSESGIFSDHKLALRDTDNKVLGTVGPDTHILQNHDAFNWFDPYIESGQAKFETAGSLREGQRVWILAKLSSSPIEVVKDDVIVPYLLLSNAHDGTMAARIGFTPTRVVCANTLAMAHSNAQSKLLRVMHSSKVRENMESIREIINLTTAEFEATAEQYRKLATKSVSVDDLKKYVKIVFKNDLTKEGVEISEREQVFYDKMVENITRLFETGRGNTLPEVRGTYWALYNAATEYLSYENGRSQDTILNKLWFGDGRNKNKKAFEEALVMAA